MKNTLVLLTVLLCSAQQPVDSTAHRFSRRYRPNYEAPRALPGDDVGFEGVYYTPSYSYRRRRQVDPGTCAEVTVVTESSLRYRIEVLLPLFGAWTPDGLGAAIDFRLGTGRAVSLRGHEGAELTMLPGALLDELTVTRCR